MPVQAQDGRGTITQRDGLPSEGVTALAWGGEGLWVGTLQGLGQWQDGETRTVEFPLAERHILALHHAEAALWVGTADGIARDEGGAWQTWAAGDAGLRSDWATGFAEHGGALHVGTYGGGVQAWAGTRWETVGDNAPAQVTTLASSGPTLWAGTPRGLWSWEGTRWWRENVGENPDINALAVTESVVWAGTEAGLFRRSLSPAASSWERVAEGEITTLAVAPRGLVVATLDGVALVREDGSTGEAGLGGVGRAPTSSLLYADGRLFAGTLGQGVRWQGTRPEVAQAAPKRLPIVLLHGLGDSDDLSASNFRFLAQWLRRDGYTVTLAPFDERRPLLDNAATLRRVVARVQRETEQEQVILIAHSFGGLVGRAFLASGTDAVAGLATLGTPHAGARMAYDFIVPELADGDAPPSREVLPEHTVLIAPFGEGGQVPQLHVGGDILPQSGLVEGFPPNDGRITAASAVAAPGATRIEPLAHGWSLEILAGGIPSFLWPDDLYAGTLRPWMQSVAAGAAWQERADAPPLPEPGFTRRQGFSASVQAGETVTLPVSIPAGATTWFLEGDGATMDLLGPDGALYRHDRVLAGSTVAHLPSRDNAYLPLDLWTTEGAPGEWQAVVANPTSRPVTATLSLIEPDGPTLEVVVEEQWVAPDSPVAVRVRGDLRDAVTATLGGASVSLSEGDDGDYRGTLVAPPEPGYYPLLVEAGDLERWAIVGVRSAAWSVQTAEVTRGEGTATLRLSLEGAGRLALGVRLLRGEEVVSSRLIGPFRFDAAGTHTLSRPLALPDSAGDLRLEWQLFDARGALVPVTPLNTVEIAP